MTQTPSANDVLMGGGGAITAKFTNPGDTIGGHILAEPRVYQEREYNPRNLGNGAPKHYPKSGDPIMSVSVDVQTDLRDPTNPEDDGVRRIYIEGKRLKDAVRDAIRTSGDDGLHVGAQLHVTFTGLGQAENDMNAPKLYLARYVPASTGAAMAALGTTPAQPAQQTAPVQQTLPVQQAVPVQQPVQQAVPVQQVPQPVQQTLPVQPAVPVQQAAPALQPSTTPDPAALAHELLALGVPDATIQASTGLDIAVIAQLRAATAA